MSSAFPVASAPIDASAPMAVTFFLAAAVVTAAVADFLIATAPFVVVLVAVVLAVVTALMAMGCLPLCLFSVLLTFSPIEQS